jgi:Domain of unknown function (DUF4136)
LSKQCCAGHFLTPYFLPPAGDSTKTLARIPPEYSTTSGQQKAAAYVGDCRVAARRLKATLKVTLALKHQLILFPVCLLAGCASLHVSSDVNPELIANVQCHTFAWAGSFSGNNPLRETVANPLNESRLRAAIASHFPGGVRPAGSNADCLVGYGIGSRAVTEWAYPNGWGYPWGWYWWGPYEGPYVFNEGVIAVDLYDAKSRQPLWHASVEENLDSAGGTEAERRIDDSVAAIFSKYPYGGSVARAAGSTSRAAG